MMSDQEILVEVKRLVDELRANHDPKFAGLVQLYIAAAEVAETLQIADEGEPDVERSTSSIRLVGMALREMCKILDHSYEAVVAEGKRMDEALSAAIAAEGTND